MGAKRGGARPSLGGRLTLTTARRAPKHGRRSSPKQHRQCALPWGGSGAARVGARARGWGWSFLAGGQMGASGLSAIEGACVWSEARRAAPEPGWALVWVPQSVALESMNVGCAVQGIAEAPSRGEGRARPVVPTGEAVDQARFRTQSQFRIAALFATGFSAGRARHSAGSRVALCLWLAWSGMEKAARWAALGSSTGPEIRRQRLSEPWRWSL